jgi:hypothetical protein
MVGRYEETPKRERNAPKMNALGISWIHPNHTSVNVTRPEVIETLAYPNFET